MEDCVDKNESVVALSNLKPGEFITDEGDKTLINGDEPLNSSPLAKRKRESADVGIIETVALKLGFASSSEVSNGEKEKAERNGETKEDDEEINASAGIMETVAYKLGFSSNPAVNGEEEERNGEKKEDREEIHGSVGIIETVASKLGFGTKTKTPVSIENGGERDEGEKHLGIINQILTKLPESLPLSSEDQAQAPAADEASLLISIIDD